MILDTGRLEGLLTEAKRCDEKLTSVTERATFVEQKLKAARRSAVDTSWLEDMLEECRADAAEVAEQNAELERSIRSELTYIATLIGPSVAGHLDLARFLDEHGRDGTPMAERATLLQPSKRDEALDLTSYLECKGQLEGAIRAAHQGWYQFGDRRLRSQWADLLARAGHLDDLIQLLQEDLRAAPHDLALIERLAAMLVEARRWGEAYEMMQHALNHPAGATRVLAGFMQAFAAAGQTDLAVDLAGEYLRNNPADTMQARRDLAESLCDAHFFRAAVKFLDFQVDECPDDRDLQGYRTNFFVNSVRCEHRATRNAALELLHERRDFEVENQLVSMFAENKGDELRLLLIDSLLQIQGLEALPFLQDALSGTSRRVRMAVVRAIERLAGSEVEADPWSEAATVQRSKGAPIRRPGRVYRAPRAQDGEAEEAMEPAPHTAPLQERGLTPQHLASRSLAIKALRARLTVETDDGIRQALAEALHAWDPRPRQSWERALGHRSWAEDVPLADPLPRPEQRQRRVRYAAGALVVLALVGLVFAPIEPSPRKVAMQVYGEAAGLLATRQAGRHPTETPQVTPNPTATRPVSAADMASGQISEAVAPDVVRVQLSGQMATVRYIGIEVPAAGEPGSRAAQDANRNLVIGRMAYLEQGAIAKDSSGRWLRYVWLPEGQMANEKLLELGFAAPAADPQDTKYQQRLAEAASKAWKNRAGFWKGGSDVFPMAAVRSEDANVRESPNTDKPVKLQVKEGTVMTVLGRNEGADWVAVRTPDFSTGWISVQVVDTTVPVASLPLVR